MIGNVIVIGNVIMLGNVIPGCLTCHIFNVSLFSKYNLTGSSVFFPVRSLLGDASCNLVCKK